MADSKGTFETLQNLIETCRNGQNGYLHAAAKVEDPELKSFFEAQSRERGRFAVELTAEAEKLGKVAPHKAGTVAGMMHRAWFAMKADFGGADKGILSAVRQGEARAEKFYKQAEGSRLPESIRSMISRQHESVKAAQDRVRAWGTKPLSRSA